MKPISLSILIASWSLFLGLSPEISTANTYNSPALQDKAYFLPPEYSPTHAVVVSEIILEDENGYLLLKVLLEAGVEVWLLTPDSHLSSRVTKHLQDDYGIKLTDLQRIKFFEVMNQSLWARDWAPVTTLPVQSSGQNVLRMLDFQYFRQRPLDDNTPGQIAALLAAQPNSDWQYEVVKLPISVEGGNIMCNQTTCVLSDEILMKNIKKNTESIKFNKPNQIQRILQSTLAQHIRIVPSIPYESTGHIDMWAKFLNENTLLISEVEEKAFDNLYQFPANLRKSYAEIGDFLEKQATGKDSEGKNLPESLYSQLSKLIPDLKIIRVPLPLPYADHNAVIFRSYTNSLLVNGFALVPRYARDAYGRNYPDQFLLKDYETRVGKAYEQAGFKVVWLDADYLIANGGAWHCATMQIPSVKSSENRID